MNKTVESLAVLLRWNLLERIALTLSEGDPTFQGKRDDLFRPFARVAIWCGFSANALSWLGVVFAVLAAITIFHPLVAAFFLAFSLLLDGLDGVVARITKTSSTAGEILDIACDTIGMLAIVTGLVVWGYLSISLFIAYVFVLISYTALSSFKSKVLTHKYRSIGSRVVVTTYIALCLALAVATPETVARFDLMGYGILAVTMVLFLNLIWDITSMLVRFAWSHGVITK